MKNRTRKWPPYNNPLYTTKDLKHQNYVEVLQQAAQERIQMKTIRSDHHEIYSCVVNKVGLSAYDDKRYILNDGMNTLAIGHYKTNLQCIS